MRQYSELLAREASLTNPSLYKKAGRLHRDCIHSLKKKEYSLALMSLLLNDPVKLRDLFYQPSKYNQAVKELNQRLCTWFKEGEPEDADAITVLCEKIAEQMGVVETIYQPAVAFQLPVSGAGNESEPPRKVIAIRWSLESISEASDIYFSYMIPRKLVSLVQSEFTSLFNLDTVHKKTYIDHFIKLFKDEWTSFLDLYLEQPNLMSSSTLATSLFLRAVKSSLEEEFAKNKKDIPESIQKSAVLALEELFQNKHLEAVIERFFRLEVENLDMKREPMK